MTQPVQMFCQKCGALAGFKKVDAGYSSSSGKPLHEYLLKCPNWKWWNRSHFLRQVSQLDLLYEKAMREIFR